MWDSSLYQSCRNEFLVLELKKSLRWQNNHYLRNIFSDLGKKNNVDSVLVLSGNPRMAGKQGYHYKMQVFEPRGNNGKGMAGTISTMCGNGIRVVAAYTRKRFPDLVQVKIMTLSGLRTVEVEGRLYTVNMGKIVTGSCDLKKYANADHLPVHKGDYLDSAIPAEISKNIAPFLKVRKWSIGLTGNRHKTGIIDGEPHVIVELPAAMADDIRKLRKLAVRTGPYITKNTKFFPEEINVNFITIIKMGKELEILNCTHERNLGDDPEHSVTESCGTGSTLAGGLMLKKFPKVKSVLVHCLGGDLIITRSPKGDELLMTGPAGEIKKQKIFS